MRSRNPVFAAGHRPAQPVRVLLCLAIAVVGTACSDTPLPPAVSGVYTATLEAPEGHMNGAALVRLTGAGIDSVSARYGRIFTQREGDAVRVIIVTETPGVLNFAVHMQPDAALPAADILEVSDQDDALRGSLQGYELRFRQ